MKAITRRFIKGKLGRPNEGVPYKVMHASGLIFIYSALAGILAPDSKI